MPDSTISSVRAHFHNSCDVFWRSLAFWGICTSKIISWITRKSQ